MLPPALAGQEYPAAHKAQEHEGSGCHVHEVQLRGQRRLHRLTCGQGRQASTPRQAGVVMLRAGGGRRTGSTASASSPTLLHPTPQNKVIFYVINQNCKLSLNSLLHQPICLETVLTSPPFEEED